MPTGKSTPDPKPPPTQQPATPIQSPPQSQGVAPAFQWGGDIGKDSVAGIRSLVNSSGIVLPVMSSFRPGDPGLHGKQNAVDFGGSIRSMRDVCAYLMQYSPYFLELIHTDDTVDGGGFYVHNGKRVPQSFYNGPDITTGGNIIAGHRDHIHVATTMSALVAAANATPKLAEQFKKDRLADLLVGNPGQVGGSNVGSSNLNDVLSGPNAQGCLKRTVAFLVVVGGFASMIVTMVV